MFCLLYLIFLCHYFASHASQVPTGSTEFQFQAGDLNFHANAFDWLVIAGDTAKFQGTGTINGSGEYTFQVWVGEEGSDCVDSDKFRIVIAKDSVPLDLDDPATLYYDNDENQCVGKGSIGIHTQGNRMLRGSK